MWFLGALFGATATLAIVFAVWTTRRVRRLPGVRRIPVFGVRPPPPPEREEGADLLAYPERLRELEDRLVQRHRAVQDQMQVMVARRSEVAAKEGRQDLAKKYDADMNMLDRRAESMRRVMGLVWKTRALLLMRVHVAVTARRRPALGRLPEPGARGINPAEATTSYHEASAAVRFYLDMVEDRARDFDTVVPAAPPSAEVDEAMREEVARERGTMGAVYVDLRDRMDRLADNLTFLGDHFGALAVVDSGPEDLRSPGGPAHLLEEVSAAIAGLNELAGHVDPAVIDSAVNNLAEEITHLEEVGLEAQAEADAHLEVERLLGQFST